jgi:glycosyltransferase involved in cell wall biosynthesis
MKILFDCHVPFMLAHGGLQIQILRTFDALKTLGLEVEFLRWWDGEQKGEVVHFFGRMPMDLVRWAQQKGMKVVQAELLTEQGSRSRARLRFQGFLTQAMKRLLPRAMVSGHQWESYRLVDACVALTPWEACLMAELFAAPPERIHVIPNGTEDIFLQKRADRRGTWLICTATITERKRVLELASAAVLAQTPLWIVGRPYATSDAYAQRFIELAKAHPRLIRYEGPIEERARLAQVYGEARGFVLLSAMESMSLSALEAAACACPLLLSDLPWARTVFGQGACYCPVTSKAARTAAFLRQFYDAAPGLKPPPKPLTWVEVAGQLKLLYERLLKGSPQS